MLKEGEVIGAIAIYRQEVRPFTDKQIALVQNFAAQAVIAIENARLLSELRQRTDDLTESLEQQTATSEVLKVISSSPGELEPVFQAMLKNATRICEAKFGNLWLREGDKFRIVAMHGASPDYVENWSRQSSIVISDEPRIPLARLAKTKRTVHVADLRAEPAYKAGSSAPLVTLVDSGGARTLLIVPMLKEHALVGAIAIYRQEVRPFADKQIALLQNFAAQAVIAIENTRLLNELRESLGQQTATAELLQVINSSPGDLAPVFDAMLEKALSLCEAAFGGLWTYDGERFHAMAMQGVPALFAEFHSKPLEPVPGTGSYALVRGDNLVHVADITDDEGYRSGNPAKRALGELGGARTALWLSLRKDELLGTFMVYRQEVRPFTEKQIALLQNFAAQAVIAMENARLLNDLRQRTTDLTESLEQQTATSEVLRVISSSPGHLQPVFEAILENATRICEAKFANLWLREGDKFRIVATYGGLPEYRKYLFAEPLVVPEAQSAMGRIAMNREVVQIDDISKAPTYGMRMRIATIKIAKARTLVGVPMLKDNDVVGIIAIYRQEVRPFTEKQVALLTNFAAQAVIAIENTRLLNELRQRTDELGRSVGELRALGEVSQAVNSTLNLETVLSTIVAKAVQLSGTEAGAIYVFDEVRRELHLRATYGMDRELIDTLARQHIGLDEAIVAQALAECEPVQIADLKEQQPSAVNEIILRAGFRALLVAPLLRGEEVVGTLVVRRRTPGAFAQNTVDLIKTFAAQSAVAIENARLFQNVETSLQDLRTAQDRLVQTEKLASLGQLTAGIAHEIKNPLNFVNNFSAVSVELIDELREALGGIHLDSKLRAEISEIANTLQGNLDKVVQHGKRADAIVKNMLLHSRQGSGEHRPVDVNALVEESLNLAYHGARAEKQGFNITLERSFDPAAGEVDLFPQEITRVLLNLISNGFYAATKRKAETNGGNYEPTLAAATKTLGDSVEIRIRDNGTGISPEVKEKLFNPFFTTKPAGEGTGLGLSISHDIIVKQHGGSIEVDTQPGSFTEFRIVLPRAGASLIKSGERA